MSVFESITAILPEYESLTEFNDYLAKSLLISKYLAHELHLLVKASDVDYAKKKAADKLSTLVTHPIDDNLLKAASDAIVQYQTELLIIPKLKETQLFASLLESISIPIFLLKKDTEIHFPLDSLFVPISGDPIRSAALEFALELAIQLSTPIDLIHITCGREGYCSCCNETLMENVSDQFYYEYSHRMDKILAETCPFSTFKQKKWVREMCGCTGDIAEQVTRIVSQAPNCALVLEWNGTFLHGHAQRLREIFEKAHCPILLVRSHEPKEFKLKVAKDF